MTKDGLNRKSSNTLQNWLITLSIFFISFFGVILALIFIFALPDKTVRPLEGSLFFISSSVIVVAFLFLRWKKEKAQESEILSQTLSETPKIIMDGYNLLHFGVSQSH
jgi:uncharacterized membrane protein YqjE